MNQTHFEFLCRLAKGIAAEFGSDCEVVVHDLTAEDPTHTVVAIENGHVSGREVGDGPSGVVLQALHSDPGLLTDKFAYLTRTEDGRVLKSTTVFYQDEEGTPTAVLAINFDITMLLAAQNAVASLTEHEGSTDQDAPTITQNISGLLDDLIEQSVRMVGKPVPLMTKSERVKAVAFLDDAGAFLVRQSSQKVCAYFGISKFTLYSYLDEVRANQHGAEDGQAKA